MDGSLQENILWLTRKIVVGSHSNISNELFGHQRKVDHFRNIFVRRAQRRALGILLNYDDEVAVDELSEEDREQSNSLKLSAALLSRQHGGIEQLETLLTRFTECTQVLLHDEYNLESFGRTHLLRDAGVYSQEQNASIPQPLTEHEALLSLLLELADSVPPQAPARESLLFGSKQESSVVSLCALRENHETRSDGWLPSEDLLAQLSELPFGLEGPVVELPLEEPPRFGGSFGATGANVSRMLNAQPGGALRERLCQEEALELAGSTDHLLDAGSSLFGALRLGAPLPATAHSRHMPTVLIALNSTEVSKHPRSRLLSLHAPRQVGLPTPLCHSTDTDRRQARGLGSVSGFLELARSILPSPMTGSVEQTDTNVSPRVA
ncbi:hypothetical protein CYMTET_12750 [Cymbomonas tetramitiformis]|uniref:Uncharacterized protein n=1 Tax=Cymbomonas tetramitiformis TaxID=36881 RepID=A0AAE0LC47_9CHLO|nr:hypothetical protein CYMTET_12750 [Cymbomonas tetramitiformis]